MTAETLQIRFFQRPHNVYDVALYTYLLTHGGGRHRLCTRDMALVLGMSKRSLLDARRRLEIEGLIVVVEKGHGQLGAVYEVVGLDGGGDGNGGFKKPETPNGKHAEEDDCNDCREAVSHETKSAPTAAEDRAGEADARAHMGELRVDDALPDLIAETEKEWVGLCKKKMAMTEDEMKAKLVAFVDLLVCDGVRWKNIKEFKRHFNRWCRISNQDDTKTRKDGRRQEKQDRPRQGGWKTKQEQREEQIRNRRAADYAALLQAAGRTCASDGGCKGFKGGVF